MRQDQGPPRRRQRNQGRARMVSRGSVTGVGFETFEGSDFLGSPIEGFEFSIGATFYRFTSADADISLAGLTYVVEAIVRTAMDFSQENSAGNITVTVPATNAIAALFVSYIPVSPVSLTIYRKHRGDPEIATVFVGKVASCSFEGPEAVMVCAPIRNLMQRRVPSVVFQSQCNWTLYGVGCGVVAATFKVSGTVIAVAGTTITAAIFGTQADGWFTNGWLEVATGGKRFIVSHVGTSVEVMNPFPELVAGGAFDAFPGCDRTEAICLSKFANLTRHLGFPRIPTRNPYGGAIA